MLWTKRFWLGAAERAIKTVAQSLVAVLGVAGTGLLTVDWVAALSVAGAAGLASLLTSIGSAEHVAGPQPDPTHADGQAA